MGENAESDRKKANTFTAEEIERFLTEAPDDSWLAIKVAAIFGFLGACRRAELRNITTADIEVYYSDTDREKKNPMIHINIPKTKTNKPRSFTLEDEYYKIYKKYDILRSQAAKGRKDFFLQYHNGKCSNQVIGVNTFDEMPKKVALFLGLDQPEKYTGHSWRRTSATLLVDGGADITMLKRHGGWRSDQVAEGYIESSRNEKRKIYIRLTSSINLKPPITSTLTSTSMSLTSASSALSPKSTTSLTLPPVSPTLATETTSTDLDSPTKENKPPTEIISPRGGLTLQISNCSNCTFQFVHKKEDD